MKKSLLALITVIATIAGYAQSFDYEGITYTVLSESDKTCELTKGDYSSVNVEIPATVPYNDEEYAVTTIGDWAFDFCYSLNTITFPIGLTTIGDYAFSGCRLRSITLPESLTTIGTHAFAYCPLTSIILPERVITIGYGVFDFCSALTTIDVADNNQYYSSIDGVLFTKDKKTLICCPGGKEGAYEIPEGVTVIGDGSFWECNSLISINLPESVTSIGHHAFGDCYSLTTINISQGVATIGEYAFYNCSSLSVVNSYSINPPVCDGDYVFDELAANATLHVPEGTKDAYASAEGWRVFANIVDDLVVENGIREIEIDRVVNEGEPEIYNLQGSRMNVNDIEELPAGIYIVGGKKVLVK